MTLTDDLIRNVVQEVLTGGNHAAIRRWRT